MELTVLIQAANPYTSILVRAVQCRQARILYDDPIHSVNCAQSAKVRHLEILPPALCLNLAEPLLRKRRKHGDRTAVLDRVGEHATLRNGSESMRILSGNAHVFRVQSENSVNGRVLADPHKRLCPAISLRIKRPLQVRAGWEKRSLGNQHSRGEGNKQSRPSP